MSEPIPDPVLRSARREALVVLVIWLTALVFSIGVSYRFGYQRPVEDLQFILGFPDWIFWGVLAPWTACTLLSGWFAFGFMTDEDLDAGGPAGETTEPAREAIDE